MTLPSTLRSHALGAYLGLAVGDALGATVEFLLPREIQTQYGVHRDIIGGGWLKLKPGQITDDTQMSLALGNAILAARGWDTRIAAEAFAAWLRSKPIDVGNTCRRGIQRYVLHGTLEAPYNEADGGNGACMRNLPVALATLCDARAFETQTLAQSHITHHHRYSDAATLALGRMVQALILGATRDAVHAEAQRLVDEFPVFRYSPYAGRASGYIVDTVQTVLHHFFALDDFESCVVAVVNRGEDADTTGALAGMLAGAAYGVDAIPKRWLKKLDPRIVAAITEQTDALLTLALRDAA